MGERAVIRHVMLTKEHLDLVTFNCINYSFSIYLQKICWYEYTYVSVN